MRALGIVGLELSFGVGLLAASLVGCTSSPPTARSAGEGSSAPTALHSASPDASAGRHDCYARATYQGGSVLLDFANAQGTCATVLEALRRLGAPFDWQLTPLSRLSSDTAGGFTCVKAKFFADVMAVFPDNGDTDTAIAFCTRLIGHGPPSPSQAA
jgi:hypothetical protein